MEECSTLPIFICEDNQTHLDKLKNIIEECINEKGLDCKIVLATQKGGELIAYLEDKSRIRGIYFLDIDLKSVAVNGIDLGRIIRNASPGNIIIYVTSHEEAAYLTFKSRLGCTDFILKDDWRSMKKRVYNCLSEVCEKEETEREQWLSYRGNLVQLRLLFYIENSHNQHRIVFHYKDSVAETWGSLKEIKNDLSDDFFHCSRSLIVNLKKIQYLDDKNKKIMFINGLTCDTSKSGIHALMDKSISVIKKM